MDLRFKPRFLRRFAELETEIVGAVSSYVSEVRNGAFPTQQHSFGSGKGRPKVARLY